MNEEQLEELTQEAKSISRAPSRMLKKGKSTQSLINKNPIHYKSKRAVTTLYS